MKKPIAALLFVFITSLIQAQPRYQPPAFTDPDRLQKISATFPVIDELFIQFAEQQHIPGAVWGLMVDGQLVYSNATGYSDIQKKIPATSKSVFRIASMTKSFTAMAIIKLRDEGKLHLDDPAAKYIPEMQKLRYVTEDAQPVTIRQLLTHAAGFPEDNPWGDRQLADSEEDLVQLLAKGISFSTTPGTAYEYSNLGFTLLGRIISNVSGKPYGEFIEAAILKPLGMSNTYWEFRNVPASQLAHGYRWLNGGWREEALLPHGSWGAMGGMLTSLEDFARYVAFHQSAWPPDSRAEAGPLSRSSVREMHHPWNFAALNTSGRNSEGRSCPTVSAYAYGLRWVRDCEQRTMVGHSGGLPGFGSNWQFLPEHGIAVISFANRTYAGMGGINMRVIDTLIKLAELKPAVLPASAILNQRKNELIQLLPSWAGATSSGIFAENFFDDYILDSLKKQSADIFREAGNIKAATEIKALNQLRGSFHLVGENKNIEVWFTLSPEVPALIQEYRIRLVNK